MTRSLGDYYLHRFGVSWEPEVQVIDLEQVCGSLRCPVLCLGSDGIWDLWTYDEVFQQLVTDGPPSARRERALHFMRANEQKGADEFGDSADNMTGIFVFFDPPDEVVEEPPPGTVERKGGGSARVQAI